MDDYYVTWWDRLSPEAQEAFCRSEYVQRGETPASIRNLLAANPTEPLVSEAMMEYAERLEDRLALKGRDSDASSASPPTEREKRGPTDDVLLAEVRGRHARYPNRGISFACDLVGNDHGLSGKRVGDRIKESTGKKTLQEAIA